MKHVDGSTTQPQSFSGERTQTGQQLQCPSSQPGIAGSHVLGRVQDAERSGGIYYGTAQTGDQISSSGSAAELTTKNYRFAAQCLTDECTNWSGSACRVVERLVQIGLAPHTTLPACLIRNQCRWFAQEGVAACRVCAHVVTDQGELLHRLNAGFTS